MVDKQAKTSLSLEPTSFKVPFSKKNKFIIFVTMTLSSDNDNVVVNGKRFISDKFNGN